MPDLMKFNKIEAGIGLEEKNSKPGFIKIFIPYDILII